MAAVKIDDDWMLWRSNMSPRQDKTLKRVSALSAEAAHEYRMGRTPVGYTSERNAMIVRAVSLGVPIHIIAIAAGLSQNKIGDIKRDAARSAVAA